MAERKTTSKTSLAKSKKAAEKEAERLREEAVKKAVRRHHITSVILFAVGIFLSLAAMIPGNEGEGWRVIFDIMHGLFGYAAYLVGPMMIYAAVLISANTRKNKIILTIVKTALFVLMFSAAVQIFFVGGTPGEDFWQVIVNLYNDGVQFKGGGVFALIIGGPLLLLGQLGAAIIIIIVALVCVLLVANITVADLMKLMGKPVKRAKDFTVEQHRRFREETELAEQEFERMELERIQAEIDAEASDRRDVERLRKVVYSVDQSGEKTAAQSAEKSSGEPQSAPPEEEKHPEPPNILAEQQEDNSNYMDELRGYIMEKNKALIEAAEESKKDALEDTDGELVPIIEAIRKYETENTEITPVTQIIDAPAEDMTNSDEGELPFDLDDILPDPAPSAELSKGGETAAPAASLPSAPKPAENQIKLSEVYTLPPVTLLNPVEKKLAQADIDSEIQKNSDTLVETLKSFGVQTKIVGVSRGPSVTRYELQPAPGVKISKITNLVDDIALNLASAGVRIEAPIPNKAAVGIEVPNKQKDTVFFRELVDTAEFRKSFDKKLDTVLGKDISGNTVTCNVAKMPHLLIAGTTGSGKSVCVNSIIMSILMKSTPEDVRLIMVDPKKVEFMMYNGIPHLLIPVVTDPKKAAGALAWAVNEMLNRYKLFSENNVRDFGGYNELAADPDSGLEKMSHIVIFIDELADLMLASPKDVEDSIVRLAQMARAAGMHLVIATQRPTVNVVTGLIKANIPSRIALMVASQMDSRVILDSGGAEKLLGNGDMLYMPVGMPKPVRVQGCFVSDKEVERTVEFIKQTFVAQYDEGIMEEIERRTEEMAASAPDSKGASDGGGDIDVSDEKLNEAIDFVVEAGQASTSVLQRRLKLGYGRAARLIDIMEEMGVVGPFEGSKPRKVLMTKQEWYERKLRQQ